MKNDKGITLVSLVITIIVLLILAGVSVAVLTGYDSIPDNAKAATQGFNEKLIEENKVINIVENLLKKHTSLL